MNQVVLQIPQELRVPIAKKLRRAYLSDYRWYAKASPRPDARVEGERALTEFLVRETKKVCEELGVTGLTVGVMTNDITDAPQIAKWYRRIDFSASLGEEVDFDRHCPEKADVLPIVYGAAPEGSEFRASLDALFHQWVEDSVRDKMQRPTTTSFNVKPGDSTHTWVEDSVGADASILTQEDTKLPTYFRDELLDYTNKHHLTFSYAVNKRRIHWRCKLRVISRDVEDGEVAVFGWGMSRDGSMEVAAKVMLERLRASIGIDESIERPPSAPPFVEEAPTSSKKQRRF
ncbi:hypothetical protein TWF679_010158 [Orbilia oligospora]|uniref:Uncharacterized protein n=1 Tax=Orbilia oligospora TaxID=2813651 RepID=A0A8H8V0Z0_ORBOL|nr:hypothetical protein TWF679_010158 [Orbilia oligospora]